MKNLLYLILVLSLFSVNPLMAQYTPSPSDECSEVTTIVNPQSIADFENSVDAVGGVDGVGDDSGPIVVVVTTETETTTIPVDIELENYDSDGDGIPDLEEGCIENSDAPFLDTDGDGIPNCLDLDSDNDGVPDGIDWCYIEYGNTPTGCPPSSFDYDGDGLLNIDECFANDIDGDGVANEYDTDSDGDGFPDGGIGADACPCVWGPPNSAGCPYSGTDFDGDGVLNDLEDPCPGLVTPNGFPTTMNPDSDGDGVMDGSDDCPCIYSENLNGCERSIFWIHGFGGSELSWAPVSDYVGQTWKTDSNNNRCIDYSNHQDGSLSDAGDEIEEKLQLQAQGRSYHEKNIAICHSLGGMAMREMDQVHDASGDKILYDGLVTIGTAHSGAGLANKGMNNPEILGEFLSWTCTKLSKPLIHQFTEDLNLIEKLISFEVLDALSNEVCLGLTQDLLMDKLQAHNESSVSSQLTTAHMTSLPDMHATHNAIIWGEEEGLGEADGSLTARIFGSVINAPEAEPLFDAGDRIDEIGMANFDELQADFLLNYNLAILDYNIAIIAIFDNLPNYHLSLHRMLDYEGAVDWFTKYHLRWMYLIEAAEIELGCVCEDWSININPFDFGPDFDVSEFSDGCESIFEDLEDFEYCETTLVLQTILKPNDGFILAESANNAPGVYYPTHLMNGSNHLQMRNDLETEKAMKFIFEYGCGVAGSFFETAQR